MCHKSYIDRFTDVNLQTLRRSTLLFLEPEQFGNDIFIEKSNINQNNYYFIHSDAEISFVFY